MVSINRGTYSADVTVLHAVALYDRRMYGGVCCACGVAQRPSIVAANL